MTNKLAMIGRYFRQAVSHWFPGSFLDRDGVSPWNQILRQTDPDLVRAATRRTGSAVVLATSVGSSDIAKVANSVMAMALQLRGATPYFLLDDRLLTACEAAMYVQYANPETFARSGLHWRLCRACYGRGQSYTRPLPIPALSYSQYVDRDEAATVLREAQQRTLDDCFKWVDAGANLGESVKAGTIRFFANSELETEDPELVLAVARRYLAAAIITARVTQRLIDAIQPICIVAHHGVYVPQGVIGEVARQRGVRIATFHPAYREGTLVYSHGDTYHRTVLDEPTTNWENMTWTPARKRTLEEYLMQRRSGKGDWSWVTQVAGCEEDRTRIQNILQLDSTKPTFGLLTNIPWDANIYYTSHAFDSMTEWLVVTLDYFTAHPEMQLIVRVHPHEVKPGNRQSVMAWIQQNRPHLPKNVKLIPRDSELSTYALMDMCQAVLVYGTITAVELAAVGMPVIVAADAWIRGKGFSYDASTRDEYLALLERLPKLGPLSPDALERAQKYAYHYFFRRWIPVKALKSGERNHPQILTNNLADLLPGRDPGLDVICRGILSGSEFIYEPLC